MLTKTKRKILPVLFVVYLVGLLCISMGAVLAEGILVEDPNPQQETGIVKRDAPAETVREVEKPRSTQPVSDGTFNAEEEAKKAESKIKDFMPEDIDAEIHPEVREKVSFITKIAYGAIMAIVLVVISAFPIIAIVNLILSILPSSLTSLANKIPIVNLTISDLLLQLAGCPREGGEQITIPDNLANKSKISKYWTLTLIPSIIGLIILVVTATLLISGNYIKLISAIANIIITILYKVVEWLKSMF